MRVRGLSVGVALVVWAVFFFTAPTPSALADGDPASDLLFQDNVYYPYNPPVSAQYVRDLNLLTDSAARGGYPIKVAIIASPDDLGAAQDLWQKPQDYANLLGSEIASYYNGPVLVAMPAGFGVTGANLPPNAGQTLRRVSIDSSADSDSLAGSAIDAVGALGQASGHPLPPVSSAGHRSSSKTATAVEVGAVVVFFAVGLGAALALRRRRGSAREHKSA